MLDAVADADGPLSAAEVLEAFDARGRRPGIATVYRALNAGVADGTLREVALGDGPTRFEPADRGHHHHFACDDCGRVVDIAGCPGRLQQMLPPGFTLSDHDITLRGRCDRCAAV